jgi:N-hydroxyarylamine O-acetyltransferase
MKRRKPVDTRDYLKRMNYQGSIEPTLQTLQALHHAHLLTIPFENLSIHYGQPIILQEEAPFNKIVRQHRGGFCYELNGLFAWLLRQLGFQVTLLSAGVSNRDGCFSPEFDHLTLLIHQLSGVHWLADVGFGDLFLLPLRVELELEQDGGDGRAYRFVRTSDESAEKKQHEYWTLQQLNDAKWEAHYRFTFQPHELIDFTERCSYQQTSLESHFTQKRICSLATPTGRVSLSDLRLITTVYQERKELILANEDEYIAALFEHFGIVLEGGHPVLDM